VSLSRTHSLLASNSFKGFSELGRVRRNSTSVGELQSWSGAVTHRDTNRHLDKSTDIPRTVTSPTHWERTVSLSLSARSAARPLSLSCPHTHHYSISEVTSAEPEGSAEMNVKILTLVIVLLVSLLCSASAGPMASMEHGRELEEAAAVRKPVQENPVRSGKSHRPAGWKRRRPRPRLSHKGPMPF
uniref:Apelin n=1 Tax=Neogobius melanostomus TaxID=47308 RepID=A0A8C6TBJ4_9GOBI